MTVSVVLKALLDKVTNTCCGDADKGDDKPMKIYGSPASNKKVASDEPYEATPAPRSCNFTPKETKYENVMWDDLPKNALEAAKTLGFDKDAWDTGKWLEVDDYWYEDLSEEQQIAATALGWDITSWDTKYEDISWKDLPDSVKKAAEAFGFTEDMWDTDGWPDSHHKDFEELTKDQQAALHVLGYSAYDWDES